MDSDQRENSLDVFISLLRDRFPKNFESYTIEQAISPINLMGGYQFHDLLERASITIVFSGTAEELAQIQKIFNIMGAQAFATICLSPDTFRTQYLLSLESIDSYKVYELEFTRLMEEELSKTPPKKV